MIYFRKNNRYGQCCNTRTRIDVSQGIEVNNTSASEECIICQYWYFLGKGFKFQSSVCNVSVYLSVSCYINDVS